MKHIFWSAFLLWALPVGALDLDFGMYMRAPVGTNSHGGKQISLKNPGSRGNEFRLGNEEGYGEARFTGHVLKGKTASEPYFFANMTMAFSAQMNSQYGDSTSTGDPVQLIQSYAKGGNFDGIPASFWAGKRHYRDADIYIYDLYYFADMGGVGGGLEDVPLGNGTLAIAFLQSSDNSFRKTTNGFPAKQVLDLRWFDLKLNEKHRLHLWFAGGYSAPGQGERLNSGGTYDPVEFEAGVGGIAGARWGIDVEGGHNDLAFMYGTGVLEDFSMNRTLAYTQPPTDVNGRHRWRVVGSQYRELSPRWGLQSALVYEAGHAGSDTNSRWISVGARPVYYFTDHYHLAVEGGFSVVKDEAETNARGTTVGDRTLGRITVAPEVAVGKTYFARPLVRAYLTHTWWNGANGDLTNSSSLLGRLNSGQMTALNGTSSETQVGVQCEVWF